MPLPKISTPTYELKIPSSGKLINYRPFLVKEEKILLLAQENNEPDNMVMALQSLVESCVDGVEDASVLPLFDIEFLFLKIRAKSVGEEVRPIIVCPETGEEIEITINFSPAPMQNDAITISMSQTGVLQVS